MENQSIQAAETDTQAIEDRETRHENKIGLDNKEEEKSNPGIFQIKLPMAIEIPKNTNPEIICFSTRRQAELALLRKDAPGRDLAGKIVITHVEVRRERGKTVYITPIGTVDNEPLGQICVSIGLMIEGEKLEFFSQENQNTIAKLLLPIINKDDRLKELLKSKPYSQY
jgi:hypothetical protein